MVRGANSEGVRFSGIEVKDAHETGVGRHDECLSVLTNIDITDARPNEVLPPRQTLGVERPKVTPCVPNDELAVSGHACVNPCSILEQSKAIVDLVRLGY